MDFEPSFETLNKFTKVSKFLLGEENINIIFEFGSRYGEDTIEFAKRFPHSRIFAFECNPNTLEFCRNNLKNYNNITLTEKAISNYDGEVAFYAIDKEKTITTWVDGNQGASSLLKASGKYEVEKYAQKEIYVDAITLKTFMLENNIDDIDLLWMDIQGGELNALKGLYDKIKKVKIMHIEVEFFEIYENQPLFKEILSFLDESGFKFLGFTQNGYYSADALFVNRDFYKSWESIIINYIIIKKESKFNISSIINKKDLFERILNKGLRILYRYSIFYLFRILRKVNKFDNSFPIEFYRISKRDIYLWHLKTVKPLIHLDKQYRKNIYSDTPIDIFIPTTEKDIGLLEQVIISVKKYVKHNIKSIYIVSSESQFLQNLALKHACVFINERSLLGFSKGDLKYNVNGNDRSGWLFQQLLKLSADNIITQDYFLVIDSDTIFTRPKIFLYKNKMIFDQSEEWHEPYHNVFNKIFGFKTKSRLSFITHYMLFNKYYLKEMKQYIEQKHGKVWIDVVLENVDYNSNSGFSEYETFGNFMLEYHKKSMIREYWFNYSSSEYPQILPNFFKSLSLHSYKRD